MPPTGGLVSLASRKRPPCPPPAARRRGGHIRPAVRWWRFRRPLLHGDVTVWCTVLHEQRLLVCRCWLGSV